MILDPSVQKTSSMDIGLSCLRKSDKLLIIDILDPVHFPINFREDIKDLRFDCRQTWDIFEWHCKMKFLWFLDDHAWQKQFIHRLVTSKLMFAGAGPTLEHRKRILGSILGRWYYLTCRLGPDSTISGSEANDTVGLRPGHHSFLLQKTSGVSLPQACVHNHPSHAELWISSHQDDSCSGEQFYNFASSLGWSAQAGC